MSNTIVQTTKIDTGFVVEVYKKVGEPVTVTRRDDLRGCWEVAGEVYGNRAEAQAAAEDHVIVTAETPEPTV